MSQWDGTLAEEVERQKSISESFGGARPLDDDATFTTPGELSGTTFGFASQRTLGRMWVSVDEVADRSVIVVGVSTDAVFSQALPDFRAMVDSIRTARP